jgi:cobalt transporter subunit CbtB
MTALARARLEGTATRSGDRVIGAAFLLVGALVVYVALLGDGGILHELLHDGRHLNGAPCH